MRATRRLAMLALAILALALAGGAVTAGGALASSNYRVVWWTVDAGGGYSEGDAYSVVGTVGQPDPGVQAGGGYRLQGGFWVGGPPPATPSAQLRLYLPHLAAEPERQVVAP